MKRQDQKLWESEQKRKAFKLLGIYNSLIVLAQNLQEDDKQNIAALIADNKYHSYVKLQANIKAQLLQQVFHEKVGEEGQKMNRGGVMILQMLEQAVEDQFRQRYANMAEDKAKKETMDGLGW